MLLPALFATQIQANSQDLETLVANTHLASLQAREKSLRDTIAKDRFWIKGVWGDTIWSLAALYLNEKVDQANAKLLKNTQAYLAQKRKNIKSPVFRPESDNPTPWAYFGITDYVRILYLFRKDSPHFPGRLQPQTEAAMKEALWLWVKEDSQVASASPQDLLLHIGTENHDLTHRPNHYLITTLLKDDPAYQIQKLDDGHTIAQHSATYQAYFREWPRKRAATGLWFEVGSNTYQKYSWPALFNLHDLSPDPVIRKRFGQLLDLAFIEEAQISVHGRRGGGRSRASGGSNSFESYKNLLYAPSGLPTHSSHSKVIETSRYQLPPAAIHLRYLEFPTKHPFTIQNRVLGELHKSEAPQGFNRYTADSALVNYAYRTPHYLLGSTLQNPALQYGGISKQNRWCGMLFQQPDGTHIPAVYPVIEKTRGGRPQHPFWSVQHENILLLQRIAPQTKTRMGSYSTGKVGIKIDGDNLAKYEKNGWIFAASKQAFIGIKFLDGGYEWDEKQQVANPTHFTHKTDTSRILLHAGDVQSHGSFSQFRNTVFANQLTVTKDAVDYHSANTHLQVPRFNVEALTNYTLPKVNGAPINLRPQKTFQSPYFNSAFGSGQVSVTVGDLQRTLDFTD